MKANMGNPDRIIRVFVAAIIALLYGTKIISGVAGTIFLVIAGIFFVTSVVGTCPLYSLFGVGTKASDKKAG